MGNNMKITLCGSIAFIDEMTALKNELKLLGHDVKMPPIEIELNGKLIPVKDYYAIRKQASDTDEYVWQKKAEAMHNHFDKVVWSDAVLVVNPDKNGIASYIGANTLLEMGLAFHLKKPIYLYQSLPDMSYTEEILGMQPIAMYADLSFLA